MKTVKQMVDSGLKKDKKYIYVASRNGREFIGYTNVTSSFTNWLEQGYKPGFIGIRAGYRYEWLEVWK